MYCVVSMPTRQKKILGAIQGMPWEGPRDVQAKPKRPIASSGAIVVLCQSSVIKRGCKLR